MENPRLSRKVQSVLNKYQRRFLQRDSITLAARQSLVLLIATLLLAIISGQILKTDSLGEQACFLRTPILIMGYTTLTSLILSAIVCVAYHLQLHSLRIGSNQDANDALSDLGWVWSLGLRLAGLGMMFLVFLLSMTLYSQLGPNSFVTKATTGMILGSAILVLLVLVRVPYVTPNLYCKHFDLGVPRKTKKSVSVVAL